MEQIDLWALEAQCRREGALLVCGADEAGAGPLAGDVYAAAVILPWGWVPEGLNDSKQVTPKRRDRLFDEIREKAVAWTVSFLVISPLPRIFTPYWHLDRIPFSSSA